MCGINLIIDLQNKQDSSTIERMAAMTRHRGPDESRVVVRRASNMTVYLAANRLKITDQTDFSSQPFSIGSSHKFLLFNGEIYNHYTLRNKLLDIGVQFGSDGDTETLYHWLSIYGPDGLADLEGMFALAFIDLGKEQFFLARDRSGIKPLYYHESEQLFIASSELKPIANGGLVPKRLNERQVGHYLSFKYAAPPETFFEGIVELLPGTAMILKDKHWKKINFSVDTYERGSAPLDVLGMEELITDSLLNQLERKVPTGLLLSGGVDSSLLLALAHKNGMILPTFSAVFPENTKYPGSGDYRYSNLAADLYSSDHHELTLDRSILNEFDEFIRLIDQPIADSSYLLTSQICKFASDSVKVLLSGAGADELFGGYNRHWAFYNYLKHRGLMDLLLPVGRSVFNRAPSSLIKRIGPLEKLMKSHDRLPAVMWQKIITFNEIRSESWVSEENIPASSLLDWALWHDRTYYLVSDVLALTDKASMLHGVEVRVPYLDERLIEVVNRSSSEQLLKHGRKWVLRKILAENGGAKIANRTKEGFGLPIGPWLNDMHYRRLLEPLRNSNSMIFQFTDKQITDPILKQHQAGNKDNGPLIWSLLVLAHWLEQNF